MTKNPSSFAGRGLTALVLSLLLSTTAGAADGKPFLMQIGTGATLTIVPDDLVFHTAASVSITPKKSGFCAVTASANISTAGGASVATTIATSPNASGPWSQFHDYTNGSWSLAMTQAFVVTKNVPIAFYLNVRNSTTGDMIVETTRIWTICSAVKDPVLP